MIYATRYKIKGYKSSSNNCAGLLSALVSGPGAVALCVNSNFQNYGSGIFNGCSGCTDINHAVLLYGWTSAGHWRLKNSWGTDWGIVGHMILNSGNTCKVCKRGTDIVKI